MWEVAKHKRRVRLMDRCLGKIVQAVLHHVNLPNHSNHNVTNSTWLITSKSISACQKHYSLVWYILITNNIMYYIIDYIIKANKVNVHEKLYCIS